MWPFRSVRFRIETSRRPETHRSSYRRGSPIARFRQTREMATIPTVTFSRVLVGVDPSSESREAARQAAILADPDGSVMLLAAYDVAPGIVGGTGSHPPPYFDEDLQRERAEEGLARAREALTGLTEVAGKVARGNARDELL